MYPTSQSLNSQVSFSAYYREQKSLGMGIGLLENLIVLGFVAGISVGLPTGPPAVEPVCVDLKPAFYAPHFLQEGNGTYDIKTGVPSSNNSNYFGYTAGETYNGK